MKETTTSVSEATPVLQTGDRVTHAERGTGTVVNTVSYSGGTLTWARVKLDNGQLIARPVGEWKKAGKQ